MRFSAILAILAFIAAPTFAASSTTMSGAASPSDVPVVPSGMTSEPAVYYGRNRGYAAHMTDSHKKGAHHHDLPLKQAKTSDVIDRAQHPRRQASRASASPRPFTA